MKKKFVQLFVGCMALLPLPLVAQEASDTLSLSLEECIRIALEENPTIKVADMEIKRVDYSRKEVIGQLLPSISFGGTYNRTLAKQVAYFNMGSFGGGSSDTDSGTDSETSSSSKDEGIKMGLDNSYQMGFSGSMPLIAPQLWKTIKLNDSQILQNIEAARSSRLSLVNQVQNAYYTLLLSYDSYKVIKQNYETAIFNANLFKGKYAVGAASEYDVLRSSVQVKNIEPELLQSEISIKQAALQLKILMGMESNVPIRANNQLSDYQKDMYDQTLNLSTSLENNSSLRSLDLQTDYLVKALDVQKMAWYPTLALTGNYTWVSSSNGSPFKNFRWNPYSSVGVSLTFPIFQGGQRLNKLKQQEISVKEMSFERDNLLRSLNMQVDLQIDNIKKNVKQIDASFDNVKQAQKAFDIMEKSFQIGAATYLDLRDAELALTTAQLTYYQAIYNYLVASSDLQLLLGTAEVDPINN